MDDHPELRNSNLPPGFDEHNPYDDDDLESFPSWWQENIEKFRDHKMRPYRPPKFSDGELTPNVIFALEEELGVSIRFRSINPQFGEDWGVWIDDKEVFKISRRRNEEGRTVYGMTSERFKETIHQETIDEGEAQRK